MSLSSPTHREGRGQVLIITGAAMLVLLGIAALVVDLGFEWMLHRQEQNAADPAAIAAARRSLLPTRREWQVHLPAARSAPE